MSNSQWVWRRFLNRRHRGLAASAQRSGDVDWCRALVEHDAALHVLLIAHLPAADQARAIRSAGPQMAGDLTRQARFTELLLNSATFFGINMAIAFRRKNQRQNQAFGSLIQR